MVNKLNYVLEAKLIPIGGENGVTIYSHYKPGDYRSCINSIKEVVDKIDSVLDYNEKASEMFDINLPTTFSVRIRLMRENGPEIYETEFRDDVIYYISSILDNMNYII